MKEKKVAGICILSVFVVAMVFGAAYSDSGEKEYKPIMENLDKAEEKEGAADMDKSDDMLQDSLDFADDDTSDDTQTKKNSNERYPKDSETDTKAEDSGKTTENSDKTAENQPDSAGKHGTAKNSYELPILVDTDPSENKQPDDSAKEPDYEEEHTEIDEDTGAKENTESKEEPAISDVELPFVPVQ